MADLFQELDRGERNLRGLVLVRGEFHREEHGGNINFYLPDIILERYTDDIAYLTFDGGKRLCGSFEPKDYAHREVEPFRRPHPIHIDHTFSELDDIPTSDGGRFLLLKDPRIFYKFFYGVAKKESEVALVHKTTPEALGGLSQDIGRILELLCVPAEDERKIQEQFFRKLGFDVNSIAP